MKIYLDFEGTVVEQQHSGIGRANFGAVEVVKRLQDAGHDVILNTYRSDTADGTLEEALSYLNEKAWMVVKDRSERNDFQLKPITATKKKIHPFPWRTHGFNDIVIYKSDNEEQEQFIFIDDSATGMDLKRAVMTNGWMVDWDKVEKELIKAGILPLIMSFKLDIPQGMSLDKFPMQLPMMNTWSHGDMRSLSNIVGRADISIVDDKVDITCATYQKDLVGVYLQMKDAFTVVIGGRVLKQTNNVIEEFELKEVSLTANIKPI